MSCSNEWQMSGIWRMFEEFHLSDIIPREASDRLTAKGLVTVADVIKAAIHAESVDALPLEDFILPTHAIRRLLVRGIETIGQTDELSEEKIRVYFSGLGEGAVEAINEARVSVGKPPLRKYH